jgi:hypothetical protein
MEPDEKKILANVSDTIIELPNYYKVGGQDFYMYPPALGTMLLIERAMRKYDLSQETQGLWNILKAARKNKKLIIEILAICSFEDRKEARKSAVLHKRISEISKVTTEDAATLFMMFAQWTNDYDQFMKFFHLDIEQKYMQRAGKAKEKDTNTYTFNGKSIYGTLLSVACERYGWSYEQVIWGISLCNLNMLMADHIATIFLSDKEKRVASIPHDRTVVKATEQNKDEILALIRK